MQTFTSFRSFDRPVQVLLLNMLANNVGFYMLVPFLAGYMAHGLGMSLWLVGLVIGIRSLSQQGVSVVGGSLGDRFGHKPAIVAGSVLRTVAFALFGFVDGPIGMTVGAILTGFGGALLSPSVRAYLAAEAGQRRTEAFALLEITMHGGSLFGPVIGALLIGIDFRLVCFGAAVMFALVTLLQLRFLPAREPTTANAGVSLVRSWGEPLQNRPFVLFALSVLGFFFLYNQIYLGLPLEIERVTGSSASVGWLFTMLAVVGLFGQLPVTSLSQAWLRPASAIGLGLLLMGVAFVPLVVAAPVLPVTPGDAADWLASASGATGRGLASGVALLVNVAPLAICCLLLIGGQLLASPYISSTVATLSGGRLVGTYFGMHAVVQGVGATFGNFAGGAAFDLARATGQPGLPWLLMACVGVGCAIGVLLLDRSGVLGQTQRSASAAPAA
jgi:predicted MFS family arabinose efflux permease